VIVSGFPLGAGNGVVSVPKSPRFAPALGRPVAIVPLSGSPVSNVPFPLVSSYLTHLTKSYPVLTGFGRFPSVEAPEIGSYLSAMAPPPFASNL